CPITSCRGTTALMHLDAAEHLAFTARLDCHYLIYGPETIADDTVLAVALHGFGQTPEAMLRLTALMLGPKHAIAALQGPNQFYLSQGSNQVGYCWITRRHAESSIRLHHEMLLHVLDEAGRQFRIPLERRLLV